MDGTEIEVTQSELLKGYSREADYTRKTQALAQEKAQATAALQAEFVQLRQERAHAAQMLHAVQQQLQAEPEPDWNKLKEEDPLGYLAERDRWRDKRERLQAYTQEQARLAAANDYAEYQSLSQHVESEQAKLLQAIPEWNDAAKSKSERQAIREYARNNGYSDEELSQAYDHRAVIVLRKAMAYDALQAKKPTVVAAKVMKPTAPVQRTTSDVTRAKQRLAQTGSVDDAAALLMMKRR